MKSFDQTHLILLVVTVAFVAATMWLASKLPRKGQTWLFAAGALLCAGGIFWRYAMSMSFSPPNSHLSWETLAIQMLQVCSFNLILVILMLVPRLELARQYSFFFSMKYFENSSLNSSYNGLPSRVNFSDSSTYS